jgi:hypothetical protein
MDDEDFGTWLDRHAVAAWKANEAAHDLARADLYRDSDQQQTKTRDGGQTDRVTDWQSQRHRPCRTDRRRGELQAWS